MNFYMSPTGRLLPDLSHRSIPPISGLLAPPPRDDRITITNNRLSPCNFRRVACSDSAALYNEYQSSRYIMSNVSTYMVYLISRRKYQPQTHEECIRCEKSMLRDWGLRALLESGDDDESQHVSQLRGDYLYIQSNLQLAKWRKWSLPRGLNVDYKHLWSILGAISPSFGVVEIKKIV